MYHGRIVNNFSWIDDKYNYNTEFIPPPEWKNMFDTIDLSKIQQFLHDELSETGSDISIYPPKHLVFNAFHLTPPSKLKVVILGQDPYINPGEAMGLAFSVQSGKNIPPSLRNIFKKLHKTTLSGDLTDWAKQGVLLLNTSLTVKAHVSNSHSSQWKDITDSMISYLSDNFTNLIFMLWGGNAFKKKEYIDGNKHHVLISSHPSPLGCSKQMKGHTSFNDSNHFVECNDILTLHLEQERINF